MIILMIEGGGGERRGLGGKADGGSGAVAGSATDRFEGREV